MKKITLALSALMLSASAAMALDYGVTYALVPAQDAAQGTIQYLTAGADGSLSYSNTISDATIWTYDGHQNAETFMQVEYFTNDGKYLKFAEGEKATLSTEPAGAFPGMSSYVEGAHYLTNYNLMEYPAPTDRAYLNVASLYGEPENSEACAFYMVEATAQTTNDDITAALFSLLYPDTKVIAVTSASARAHGKYMSVDESGKLTTSNTLDLKAVWNVTNSPDGYYYIQNVSTKGYLYTADLTLSETPVEVKFGESKFFTGAVGITSDLEADAETGDNFTDGPWLNALNTKAGIGTWSLDDGSSFFIIDYTEGLTEEAVDNKVDVLLADPAAKVAKAEALFNSSTLGKENKYEYLYPINSAETLDELNQAAETAYAAAIGYAEEQISSEFGLYVNSLQQYFNYVADSDTIFQRQDLLTANGLWKAEWIEEPTAEDDNEAPAARTFKLLNIAANKYVGTFANSVMAPGVDVNSDNAGIFKLTAGDKGITIQFTNAPVDFDLYLSAYADAKLTLTSWTDVNDVNSQFSFFAIGEMTQDESYAALAGPTVDDPMSGTILTAVNAVEIMVPQGATLTGNGEVKFGFGTGAWDENWQPIVDVMKTWTADDLKAITPATREITREVYDFETWDYVTVTGIYDVYTLPLDETYAEYEVEYIVKGDAGLFSATTEDGFKLSCPLYESIYLMIPATPAELPVTPEAGKVEELTEIKIGDAGWYVYPEADGGLKLTFNGSVAKDANGDDIDCPAEEIDVRYFYWDMETFEEGYVIPVNFTETGIYNLTISEGVFVTEDNCYNEAVNIQWTIGDVDGIHEITSVTVNGQVIYDLSGRRVAKPNHGLYIINGQKVRL